MKFTPVLAIIMEGCSIGKNSEDSKCHKTSFVKDCKLENIEEFDDESVILLELRTGLNNLTTICLHHEYVYLKKFTGSQRKCCDPFSRHMKPTMKKGKSTDNNG